MKKQNEPNSKKTPTNYVEKKSGGRGRGYNTSNPLETLYSSSKNKTASSEKNKGGTYITTDKGRVSRTYGKYSPMESMDTTGYGKGKKEFDVTKSYSGGYTSSSKINRSEVPSKIQEMKKGATRNVSIKNNMLIENKKKK
jgi:hypothetical protein